MTDNRRLVGIRVMEFCILANSTRFGKDLATGSPIRLSDTPRAKPCRTTMADLFVSHRMTSAIAGQPLECGEDWRIREEQAAAASAVKEL